MFPRLRAAFRAFNKATIGDDEAISAREEAATRELTDYDFPADSRRPLLFGDSWRSRALRRPALLRCVSIIATECARLIAQTLTVHDPDGRVSEAERDRENSARLRDSVDGGATAALDFWRDAFFDLLIDGNCLIIPESDGRGVVTSLRLMSAYDAEYNEADDAYFGRVLGMGQAQVRVPRSQMVHAKMFGAIAPPTTGSFRREWPFSDSPVRLLTPTLEISNDLEDWLVQSLTGSRGQWIVSPQAGTIQKGQRKEVELQARRLMNGRGPFIAGKRLTVTDVGMNAQEAGVDALLDFQVREISRVYGVPMPLIGSKSTGAWGSGIEALAREFWKRSVAPRLHDVLLPLSHRLCFPGCRFTVDPMETIRGVSSEITGLIQVLRPNQGIPALATTDELRRFAQLAALSDEGRAELDAENERAGAVAAPEVEAEPAPPEPEEAADEGRAGRHADRRRVAEDAGGDGRGARPGRIVAPGTGPGCGNIGAEQVSKAAFPGPGRGEGMLPKRIAAPNHRAAFRRFARRSLGITEAVEARFERAEKPVIKPKMAAPGAGGIVYAFGEIVSDEWANWLREGPDDFLTVTSPGTLKQQLEGIPDGEPITLLINSIGGDVAAASAGGALLDDRIKAGSPVNARIVGDALSAASTLMLRSTSSEIDPMGLVMIHNPWTFTWGDADALEKEAAVLRKIQTGTAALYAERTPWDEDKARAVMAAETWFSAQEIVDEGVIGKVTEAPAVAADREAEEAGKMAAIAREDLNVLCAGLTARRATLYDPAGLMTAEGGVSDADAR